MFKKILIANRGEIAVRIIRTCRDLGIKTVAVFAPTDYDSLHVRLADESLPLYSSERYADADGVLAIARQTGAEAIHPGYGFLAEDAAFAGMCEQAGIAFIGPPPGVLARFRQKATMLNEADGAGFCTPPHTEGCFAAEDMEALTQAAEGLGYPIVIKSCRGGRGRGTRLAFKPERLPEALSSAQADARRIYGEDLLYLERAIWPAYHVDVQILADHHGHIIHLGDRCSSLQQHNQKLIAETPAPCLSVSQREHVCQAAVRIARLFGHRGAGTVEFLIGKGGEICFSDFKARIQVEHPITEMVSGVDIVAEQIAIASGQPLRLRQEDVRLNGWAMQCRINAEDPWNHFLPSPGKLHRFRLPSGFHVRVDTYGYGGCVVPVRYDSLLALVVTWAKERSGCIRRMQGALEDFVIIGVQTNLPLHQRVLEHPDFVGGRYDTDFIYHARLVDPAPQQDLRDVAIAAAIAYERRNKALRTPQPERLQSGWHRSARRLPV